MANRYWVGGTASWDATAGSKWSLTSGGSGGEAVPTSSDDVFFDGASGAVTITQSGTRVCRNLNMTGFTGTWAGSGALQVHGSLTCGSGQTTTYTGQMSFLATTTGHTLTFNGKGPNSTMVFNGTGGGWTIQDNPASSTTKTWQLTAGSLDMNGRTYNIGSLESSNSNTRVLTLGASTINLNNNNTVINFSTTTGLTFDAGTSTINTGAGSNVEVQSGGVTFYNLIWGAGTSTAAFMSGNNTFNTLDISAMADLAITGSNSIGTFIHQPTVASRITFTDGTTQTITTTLDAEGASASAYGIWKGSSTAGWNLVAPSGVHRIKYMAFSYMNVTGSSYFLLDKTSTSPNSTGIVDPYSCADKYTDVVPVFYQELVLKGSDTPNTRSSVGSNQDGSVVVASSSDSNSFVRYERNPITGFYRETHRIDPTFQFRSGSTGQFIFLGLYIYAFASDGTNIICTRFLAADLTGETNMTVPTIGATGDVWAWTDGTYLYVVSNSATTTTRKWSVSGTTLSAVDTATNVLSLSTGDSSVFDGTNIFIGRNNGDTTFRINRLADTYGVVLPTVKTYNFLPWAHATPATESILIAPAGRGVFYIGQFSVIDTDETADKTSRLVLSPYPRI